MDFTLSDEQRLYRDTLRDFVDREIVPVARDWEHEGRYPTEIVAGMAECLETLSALRREGKIRHFGLSMSASYTRSDVTDTNAITSATAVMQPAVDEPVELTMSATLLRIAATVPGWPAQPLLTATALLWAGIMLIWGLRYGSWYGRTRADGRPG